MRTVIAGGTVVGGDGGEPVAGAAVVFSGSRIDAIEPRWSTDFAACALIDATGCVVLPGLINSHTHGVTPGPLFPSGAASLPADTWLSHLDRHLLAGTTTVLNQCGLATMDEVRAADHAHAIKVKGATTHLRAALAAARAADGTGLTPAHLATTVEEQLADGAVAIAELGGGQTLGGGGQDVEYIPAAVVRETGVTINSAQARALKEAVLGPHLDPSEANPVALDAALASAGLHDRLTAHRAAQLIRDCVLPSIAPALDGIREGVLAAVRHQVPAIVHSAAASAQTLLELAGRPDVAEATVIAGHSNHPSFAPDEALDVACKLADAGWLVECCTFDLLHRQHTVTTRDHWDRLLHEPGCVDLLATDYGLHGDHDELLAGIADAVARGHRTLTHAVAMATGAVAKAIPGIAPEGGVLAPGRAADVVVASADLRQVRHVFVDGMHVVCDGTLTAAARQ